MKMRWTMDRGRDRALTIGPLLTAKKGKKSKGRTVRGYFIIIIFPFFLSLIYSLFYYSVLYDTLLY